MIELQNVVLSQGRFKLHDIHFHIEKNGYGVLMGETGSGKTTIVEAICGLRRIDQGKIILDGRDVTHWEPGARQVGYVPQDSALFPTMRVDQQILFGLEVRNVAKKSRQERLDELAEKLSLEKVISRFPNRLSGGEKQRVALARAIAFRPKLLCLDEPLSAVDDQTHGQLLEVLQNIHQTESVTILHITHNKNEATKLGTVQLKLQNGSISVWNEEQTSAQ